MVRLRRGAEGGERRDPEPLAGLVIRKTTSLTARLAIIHHNQGRKEECERQHIFRGAAAWDGTYSPAQRPRRSLMAAAIALVNSGSSDFGLAQPRRTSQTERSWPLRLHRAAKSALSPPGGRVQVTAR